MKYIYVDESGSITNHSENHKYFVIGMVITSDNRRLKNQLKRARKKVLREINNNPNKYGHLIKDGEIVELKGYNLPNALRRIFVEQVHNNNCDVVYCSMTINNQQINQNLKKNPNRTFNYFIKVMLTYLWKSNILQSNEDLTLVLDNRNVRTGSKYELEGYLYTTFIIEQEIFSNIKTEYVDSRDNRFVQYADLFANSVYRLNNNNKSSYIIYTQCKAKIKKINFPMHQY